MSIAKSCAALLRAAAVLSTLLLANTALAAPYADGYAEHTVRVNGVDLHYQVGGHGSPVVLLHGYAETSAIWTPLLARLAQTHTVIVPDLRGAGASEKTAGGYD